MGMNVEFALALVRESFPKACRIKARAKHHANWWRVVVLRHFGHFDVVVDLKIQSGDEMTITRSQLVRRRFIPSGLENRPNAEQKDLASAIRFLAWCWGARVRKVEYPSS